jgi:hypothetical protein
MFKRLKNLFWTADDSLFVAVENDDYGGVSGVKKLIDDGKITSTNINYKGKGGRTALMLAAERKNKRIFDAILGVISIDPKTKKTKIDEKDSGGKTALF